MATRWVPLEAALARVPGGFAELLPLLISGDIRSRADHFSTQSGSRYPRRDDTIPAWWWEENPRHEGINRVLFATGPCGVKDTDVPADIGAYGVEIDADAMDARFPPTVPPPDATQPPLAAAVVAQRTAPDPFHSGAPGRPTAMNVIEAEAERRIEAHEVVPTPGGLSKFAEELEDWWGQKRLTFNPPGPKAGKKAIANCLRDLWNSRLGGG